MIYEIAGLRISIQNRYDYTARFCRGWLSPDQTSPADLSVYAGEDALAEERRLSPG